MLPLKNYQRLPLSLRPGIEPLQGVTYSPEVRLIQPGDGVSDWLKLAQEEWRKFPPRTPTLDLDALMAKAELCYRMNQTKPFTKSKKDEWRWWLRGKLVKLGII